MNLIGTCDCPLKLKACGRRWVGAGEAVCCSWLWLLIELNTLSQSQLLSRSTEAQAIRLRQNDLESFLNDLYTLPEGVPSHHC